MREILFRGKRPNGQWVQGDLTLYRIDEKVISKISFHQTRATLNGLRTATYTDDVIPETIGQYTGLTDKNGTKIFEGDILEFSDRIVVVFWHSHLGCWDSNFLKFTNKENGRDDMSPHSWDFKSKVIGNIHDNPELLKERGT